MAMQTLIQYQWETFIGLEVLSLIFLLLFGIFRYFLDQKKFSLLFIFGFISLLVLEVLIGILIYRVTGELTQFHIVLIIFLAYALTFGYFDFKKLDRWMRKNIGKLRKKELLTEKDCLIIKRNQDPKYIAKKYRISAYTHTILFISAQTVLWLMGTENMSEIIGYLRDLSWFDNPTSAGTPYANDIYFSIGIIWG